MTPSIPLLPNRWVILSAWPHDNNVELYVEGVYEDVRAASATTDRMRSTPAVLGNHCVVRLFAIPLEPFPVSDETFKLLNSQTLRDI